MASPAALDLAPAAPAAGPSLAARAAVALAAVGFAGAGAVVGAHVATRTEQTAQLATACEEQIEWSCSAQPVLVRAACREQGKFKFESVCLTPEQRFSSEAKICGAQACANVAFGDFRACTEAAAKENVCKAYFAAPECTRCAWTNGWNALTKNDFRASTARHCKEQCQPAGLPFLKQVCTTKQQYDCARTPTDACMHRSLAVHARECVPESARKEESVCRLLVCADESLEDFDSCVAAAAAGPRCTEYQAQPECETCKWSKCWGVAGKSAWATCTKQCEAVCGTATQPATKAALCESQVARQCRDEQKQPDLCRDQAKAATPDCVTDADRSEPAVCGAMACSEAMINDFLPCTQQAKGAALCTAVAVNPECTACAWARCWDAPAPSDASKGANSLFHDCVARQCAGACK